MRFSGEMKKVSPSPTGDTGLRFTIEKENLVENEAEELVRLLEKRTGVVYMIVPEEEASKLDSRVSPATP